MYLLNNTNLDRISFSNGAAAISTVSIVAASDLPEASFALVSTVNVA